MKSINKKRTSVNGLFNNEQNVVEKVKPTNYLKMTVLVVIFSIVIVFAKSIQNTVIDNYNKGLAFMQKHNNRTISPLGF